VTELVIALAGNANVGKSTIFNNLTGLAQTIGNWPGKTVEKAEGTLIHHGQTIKIIDLPGIYSLSTYSQEEIISRDYIALGHPDVVINVVDATSLERNLFFTLQLLEMGIPLVLSLNLIDAARKKGIEVDRQRLHHALGIPVVSTIAAKGIGVHELIDESLTLVETKNWVQKTIPYGPEIETRVDKLITLLANINWHYPRRWTAIKLLENDEEIIRQMQNHPEIVVAAKILSEEIAHIHKEPCSAVIASERYAVAAKIAKEVLTIQEPIKPTMSERMDALSMHGIWGYAIMISVMLSILAFISLFGGWLSTTLATAFESVRPPLVGFLPTLAWNGAVVGLYATLAVAIGFILPFYLILGVLEDSGYLPKIAYLMDRPCHAIGLHGKACIPFLCAFGCNVPACVGCRILETKRDRLIATFLSTLVPCSARSVVILGLVGVYVGLQWAVALYLFDFLLIFLVGRMLKRLVPGMSVGIIMEMPPYRLPAGKVVLKQAWNRFKPFVLTALPLIIIGSLIVEFMRLTGLLLIVSDALSPVTVAWLGLPVFTGFLLIFGVIRKEAALILLATAAGTSNIQAVMTPVQMVVFALVIMIYVPCIATIAALVRETGWKNAVMISLAEVGLALLLGGIAYRVLTLFMM
jgi:ferrous iron transport protein B